MRQLFLSAFLICSGFCFAQQISESQLIGTWKITSSKSYPNYFGFIGAAQTISFYSDHCFQQKGNIISPGTIQYSADSALVISGKWKINEQTAQLIFSCAIEERESSYSDLGGETYFVKLKSDSTLELTDSTIGMQVPFIYNRTTSVPEIEYEENWSSPRTFFIVNSLDTTKKIKIENYDELEVNTPLSPEDSSSEKVSVNRTGFFHNVTDSSLDINVTKEETYDKIYKRETNKGSFVGLDLGKKTIPFHSINSITYTSPRHDALNGFGSSLILLGLISSSFIAPSISINFQNGHFNTHRYFLTAGFGIAGVIIGIPLVSISQAKTYFITQKNKKSEKNYWYIETIPD